MVYKIFFVSFFFIIFSIHQTLAQKNSETQTAEHISQMATKLGLDIDKAEKFDAINRNYKLKINALRLKTGSKRNLETHSELEKERDNQLKNLLSKQEFNTYVELRKKQRINMRNLIRKKQ